MRTHDWNGLHPSKENTYDSQGSRTCTEMENCARQENGSPQENSSSQETWERSRQTTRELLRFIEETPSVFHVIRRFEELLRGHGFEGLPETSPWHLKKGGKYFVTRNGSSLIAFSVPQQDFTNFQISAAHSDSPSFKIKERPELAVGGHYVELNTERYGGMIFAPWFDRPLSVAGRAVVKQSGRLETRLVHIDRDLVMLPNLAIHMDNHINSGYEYHPQKDLIPIFGDERSQGMFSRLIARAADAKESDLLASDLFLYCRTPGSIWGANQEYFSSPRLDDMQSAYAIMQGFLAGGNPRSVSVCCIFDNEEVGSLTKQGADSTMLSDVLERINFSLGRSPEEYRTAVAASFMVSADNAHALHPNHMDKADPVNRPFLNGGPVIKFNANQKYTTDAVSAAIFRELCRRSEVPCQSYANHSDIAGGSTLGNLSNAHVSLNTVDIGLPQLAMHSPYETAGVMDAWYLIRVMKEFYASHLQPAGEGWELVKES
mgnify:CR=1 FL=1